MTKESESNEGMRNIEIVHPISPVNKVEKKKEYDIRIGKLFLLDSSISSLSCNHAVFLNKLEQVEYNS